MLEGRGEAQFAPLHLGARAPVGNIEVDKGTQATSHFLTRQKYDLMLGWLSLLLWLTCWQSLKDAVAHTNL